MSLVTIENDLIATADYVCKRDYNFGQVFLKELVSKMTTMASNGTNGIAVYFTNSREGIINFDPTGIPLANDLFFLFMFEECLIKKGKKTAGFLAIDFTSKKVSDFSQNIVYD